MMKEKYESLPLATLKDLAKARGLKGISTMKKAELIERMLEGVPIIVLSGSPFHPPGAAAYLRKPVDDAMLMDAIRSALRSGELPTA